MDALRGNNILHSSTFHEPVSDSRKDETKRVPAKNCINYTGRLIMEPALKGLIKEKDMNFVGAGETLPGD